MLCHGAAVTAVRSGLVEGGLVLDVLVRYVAHSEGFAFFGVFWLRRWNMVFIYSSGYETNWSGMLAWHIRQDAH